MRRSLTFCLLLALLLYPLYHCLAGSPFGDGDIDDGLTYEGFDFNSNIVSGYIVNHTNEARHDLNLDMEITNPQETRTYWRKSIIIAELGPKAKYPIKEKYDLGGQSPSKIKVLFKIHHVATR